MFYIDATSDNESYRQSIEYLQYFKISFDNNVSVSMDSYPLKAIS